MGFNILSYPYSLYSSGKQLDIHLTSEILDNLSHVLYPEHHNTDPYWSASARTLFLGLTYTLFNLEQPDYVNINNVLHLFNQGEKSNAFSITNLERLIKNFEHKNIDDITFHLEPYFNLTAKETKSCINAGMREGLSPFLKSAALRNFLSRNDFAIQDLQDNEPSAIYIILPDESPIYYKLAGIILNSITLHYISLAQKNVNGKLRHKLNIFIDELGNIGQSLNNLPFLLSASRSRNIRISFVLQSLAQLEDIYGLSYKIINDNANIIIAFRVNNYQTLTELSSKCGNREISHRNHVSMEPLITAPQLGALGLRQALVIINGREKFIINLDDYSQIYDSGIIPVQKDISIDTTVVKKIDFQYHLDKVLSAKKEKTDSENKNSMLHQLSLKLDEFDEDEDDEDDNLAFKTLDTVRKSNAKKLSFFELIAEANKGKKEDKNEESEVLNIDASLTDNYRKTEQNEPPVHAKRIVQSINCKDPDIIDKSNFELDLSKMLADIDKKIAEYEELEALENTKLKELEALENTTAEKTCQNEALQI